MASDRRSDIERRPGSTTAASDWLPRRGGWLLVAAGGALIALAAILADKPAVAPIFAIGGVALIVLGVVLPRVQGGLEVSAREEGGAMRRRPATRGASRRRGLHGAAALAGSAVAAVAVVALVIKWAPQWLASTDGLEPRARAEEIGRTRTALLAMLAGAIATVGAIYTARSYELSRQGHITERYTSAVAQLGGDADAVRLGGIYALERIARDSPSDHRTIMDVLSAYVRLHAAPWQRFGDDKVKPDVEAAVLVLGRRRPAHEPEDGVELVLNDVNLREARIRGVHLERARMRHARLSGALLDRAWLDATALEGADLRKAHLRDASLRHASLERADLQEADLGGAQLEGAVLIGAMLAGADLRGAPLEGALLMGADLRDVAHDQYTRWPPGFDSSAQGAPAPTTSTL